LRIAALLLRGISGGSMSDGQIEAAFYGEMGRLIAVKRKHRGISQADLGSLVGCHRNTISRWESGDESIPVWMLLRLADALSCQHLLLLPSRGFTWGMNSCETFGERDPQFKRIDLLKEIGHPQSQKSDEGNSRIKRMVRLAARRSA
jgi:transcriptional regulator with XRE-family HTH domain